MRNLHNGEAHVICSLGGKCALVRGGLEHCMLNLVMKAVSPGGEIEILEIRREGLGQGPGTSGTWERNSHEVMMIPATWFCVSNQDSEKPIMIFNLLAH